MLLPICGCADALGRDSDASRGLGGAGSPVARRAEAGRHAASVRCDLSCHVREMLSEASRPTARGCRGLRDGARTCSILGHKALRNTTGCVAKRSGRSEGATGCSVLARIVRIESRGRNALSDRRKRGLARVDRRSGGRLARAVHNQGYIRSVTWIRAVEGIRPGGRRSSASGSYSRVWTRSRRRMCRNAWRTAEDEWSVFRTFRRSDGACRPGASPWR